MTDASAVASAWRQWTWTGNDGPGARRGHSLCVYKSQLIVFGGRTEDTTKTHIPKTYEIHKVDGTLEFLSYEDKIARPADSTEVHVAVHLNDVWSYDISASAAVASLVSESMERADRCLRSDRWYAAIDCTRYADESCRNSTWQVLDAGAEWGGCKNVFGAHVCSHPPERWMHRAEVFSDDSMVIYGGFSRLCEDYCDDMWLFDFTDNMWTEMMEIGTTATGPGKRFKFSSVVVDDKMFVFGGFRLWHGFAHENSVENDWSSTAQYPVGGYLNDLWVYDKASNTWTNLTEVALCPDLTLLDLALDVDTECTLTWPPGRAGHAAVYFDQAIFVHGGYHTFFPYPSTSGRGAGRGTLTIREAGFIPYPSHPYYLEDFWKYNLTTGLWTEIKAAEASESASEPDRRLQKMPPARLDHTLVATKDVFVLFGGYISNHYYDDTWQFNTSVCCRWCGTFSPPRVSADPEVCVCGAGANRWVKQKTFVHALYPTTCTDDLAARQLEHSGNYAAFVPPAGLPDTLDGYYFVKERHYGTLKVRWHLSC